MLYCIVVSETIRKLFSIMSKSRVIVSVFIFSQYFLTGCKVRDYPTMFISLFINFKPNLQFKQFSDIFCGYRKIEHWSMMD